MTIERVKVTGVQFYNGEIDGKGIDSGKIFIEERLDFTTGRAKGTATQVYSVGKSEFIKTLMHHDFPLVCEVEFNRLTTGKVSKTIITKVTPVVTPPTAR